MANLLDFRWSFLYSIESFTDIEPNKSLNLVNRLRIVLKILFMTMLESNRCNIQVRIFFIAFPFEFYCLFQWFYKIYSLVCLIKMSSMRLYFSEFHYLAKSLEVFLRHHSVILDRLYFSKAVQQQQLGYFIIWNNPIRNQLLNSWKIT